MTKEISALLKKKSWTGDEVGKTIIYSLVDAHQHLLAGEQSPPPILTPEQLRMMVHSLVDPAQMKRYNSYVGLQNWLIQYQAVATAYQKQALGELAYLEGLLRTTLAVEADEQSLSTLPLVLTQEQYNDIKARRVEEQLTTPEGKDAEFSVFRLLVYVVAHEVTREKRGLGKSRLPQGLEEAYRKAPVASARILARYNEAAQNGYQVLPDGRRSDQLSLEAWREACDALFPKAEMPGESPLEAVARLSALAQSTLKGQEQPDIAWQPYPDPPAGLTKWDVLQTGFFRIYYPVLEGKDARFFAQQAQDFQREFPELCQACLQLMDDALHQGRPVLSALSAKEWQQPACTLRTLYENDWFGFRAQVESNRALFVGNQRALQRGVAILSPGDEDDRALESAYREPERTSSLSLQCGLAQFTPASPEQAQATQKVEASLQSLLDSYYYVQGYDKAIELIAEYIGLPQFTIFQLQAGALAEEMNAYNHNVAQLYERLLCGPRTQGWTDKLAALLRCFPPVDISSLTIPEAAIQEANALLRDNLRAFEKQDSSFIGLLATRRKEAD